MMRWIAIALLLLNGTYWSWLQFQTKERATVDPAQQPFAENVKQLQLLEPVRGVLAARKATDTASPEPQEACWLIGPFDEEVSVKQVQGRLAALSIEFPVKAVEVESGEDYWVHIPPQKNRQQAIKLLRELQGKGIDSFLITEGELAEGISLGLFSQQERAERVYQQRKGQGYEAILKTVPRTHIQFWGLYNGQKYGFLAEQLWQKINQGNASLERRKKSCENIASLGEFD